MRRFVGYIGLAVGYLVLLVGGIVLVDFLNGLDWFGNLLDGLRRRFSELLIFRTPFFSVHSGGP